MKKELSNLKDSKILWYGISTLLLAVLVYTTDVERFINSLLQVDPLYMSLAMISGFSVFLVFGWIWYRIFKKVGIEADLKTSYELFMAGNFVNSITPLGQAGGEPFMAYLVSENTGTSYEKSLSAVITSDMINLIPALTYTVLGIIYLMFFGLELPGLKPLIIVLIAIIVILGGGGYLLWSKDNRLKNFLFRIVDYIEKKADISQKIIESIKERIESAEEAFTDAGGDPIYLGKTALISHIYPLTQIIALWLILQGMGVEAGIGAIGLTVILSGLAHFSPTPGGTGAFEIAFAGLLIAFVPGIAPSDAVASAVLFRLTSYWPGIPIGYLFLLHLKKN